MKKVKSHIINNWECINNLFGEEKYRCSAEGHIRHILTARLNSILMGWSIVGADEVARMRTYKANGVKIKEYYSNLRIERKIEQRFSKLDEKVAKCFKRFYNTTDSDKMIGMPYISKTSGRWVKDMLRSSSF